MDSHAAGTEKQESHQDLDALDLNDVRGIQVSLDIEKCVVAREVISVKPVTFSGSMTETHEYPVAPAPPDAQTYNFYITGHCLKSIMTVKLNATAIVFDPHQGNPEHSDVEAPGSTVDDLNATENTTSPGTSSMAAQV